MTRVNFKAKPQEDFDSFPNGSYVCEITSMELTKSSKQNDMIKVEYKVLNPPSAPDKNYGEKLFDQFSLLVQAGWKLKNFLEAAQVPHTAIPGQNRGEFELDFDTADAIGKQVVCVTEQESYQSNKVDGNGHPVTKIRASIENYMKA